MSQQNSTTSRPAGVSVTVARWLDLYRRLETDAHYHWRYGLLVAAALLAPLITGAALGDRRGGVIAALAAWFVALAVPPATVVDRGVFLGRRLALVTATTALGTVTSHHGMATLAALGALGALAPIPDVTITPVITFIMGLDTPWGMSRWHHIGCFAAGGFAAMLVLLLPWAASSRADRPRSSSAANQLQRAWGHMRSGSPRARYAGQLAVVLPLTYLGLKATHWPHPGWVLVGILTTLRPSWETTELRIVKRSIGMAAGSALTTVCLALVPHLSWSWQITIIATLGAAARPLRQYNYGLWPILGTPVLLLLANLTTPLHPWDSAWRLGNNILGAAITLITTTLLWPHEDQRPTARLAT